MRVISVGAAIAVATIAVVVTLATRPPEVTSQIGRPTADPSTIAYVTAQVANVQTIAAEQRRTPTP